MTDIDRGKLHDVVGILYLEDFDKNELHCVLRSEATIRLYPQNSGELGINTVDSSTYLSDKSVDELIVALSYYKYRKIEAQVWNP